MFEPSRFLCAAFSTLLIALPAAAQVGVRGALPRAGRVVPAFLAAPAAMNAVSVFSPAAAPAAFPSAATAVRAAEAAPAPRASKDLTADFLSLHEAVRTGALAGVALPPEALRTRFILVKGLLANRTADYFDGNRRRLERLGLDAAVLPVDTEGRSAAYLRAIGDAVRDSRKPVVLIGHSQGGAMIHDWYRSASPELKAKVSRLVILQAPVAGTPYADWTLTNAWQYLKTLVGGWLVYGAPNLPRTIADVTERARGRALAALPEWRPGDLEKVYAVRSVIAARPEHRYYEKGRARIESLGGGKNDGLVPEKSALVEGGFNIGLEDVNHRHLVVERPDPGLIAKGYSPNPRFNVGDVTETLVRLIFR